MNQEIRERLLQLMKQKDRIEDLIKQLTEILTMNGVGMDDPLVDSEGFPISSIDVYQVRHARHRIICLQNDHKAIMKQIEDGLAGYYSSCNTSQGTVEDIEMKSDPVTPPTKQETPFAKITIVTPGSPAELAGLCQDDRIVEFGSVNSGNFKNVTDIGAVVRHSEGSQINVTLKRGERLIRTHLTPRKWQGKGLLGCNIEALAPSTTNPFKEAVGPLTEGVLKIYQPHLRQTEILLKELTDKEYALQQQTHDENLKISEAQNSDELSEMFTGIETYQAKLLNIKKEMKSLHDKSLKLKRRALRVQQLKEKQDYIKQHKEADNSSAKPTQ